MDMLGLTYLLGFSFYWIAFSARLDIPYENQISSLVLLGQCLLWIKIFHNRSVVSIYHVFFSSVLGFLFSVDTLHSPEKVFLSLLGQGSFHTSSLSPAMISEKLHFIQKVLTSFDGQNYYLIAFVALFISYIFLTDYVRYTNTDEPGKTALLSLFSPPIIYLIWNSQSSAILSVLLFSIFLGIANRHWKALSLGLLLIFHPIGFMALPSLIDWKQKRLSFLCILVALLPLAVYLIYLQPSFLEGPGIQILTFIGVGCMGTFLSQWISPADQDQESKTVPASIFVSCLLLLSFYEAQWMTICAVILSLSFSALRFEHHKTYYFLLVAIMFQFGTSLISSYGQVLPFAVYITFLLVLMISNFKIRSQEKTRLQDFTV